MKIKVDTRQFTNRMNLQKQLADQVMKNAYNFFVNETPEDTGNAKRHTYLKGTTIVADYPYAERLDTGWSNQSPDGMTKPTEEFIIREINRLTKE
jgi:hypothetical protein